MRILVCGDRNWTDVKTIEDYIKTLPRGSVVIQGMCNGADLIARKRAKIHRLEVIDFNPDWERFGRAAGPIRNRDMLEKGKPDRVVAFHNNLAHGKGTQNMINQAVDAGVPVFTCRSGKALEPYRTGSAGDLREIFGGKKQ